MLIEMCVRYYFLVSCLFFSPHLSKVVLLLNAKYLYSISSQFYLEEAKGRVDYQGYIFPRRRGQTVSNSIKCSAYKATR